MSIGATRTAAMQLEREGLQLIAAGRFSEAARCFERAVEIEPAASIIWARLAKIRMAMRDYDAAEPAIARACALRSNNASLQVLWARVLQSQNRSEAALEACQRALQLNPRNLAASVVEALMLPPVYADVVDLRNWRQRFASGLETLVKRLPQWLNDPLEVLNLEWQNFLLAYQGYNDVELQTGYADFLGAMLDAALPGLRTPVDRVAEEGDHRIRVGFVSSEFRECTVGDYFVRWVTDLPRDRFHVSTFYTGHVVDARTDEFARGSDHFARLDGEADAIAAAVLRRSQDVVVLPDVGFSPVSNLLANLRLARIQCAAWGHPVTTGGRVTKYFFSCGEMEPADAALHYGETLLCLPGIGVRYRQPVVPGAAERAELGITGLQNVYICPQSLYKIHPDTDSILLEILARDERAVLLFFAGQTGGQTKALGARLQRGMMQRGIAPRRQIKFLPRMDRVGFLRVMATADVMIDAMHWSGGNTTLDALAVALPVVTVEGRFMRGRQSAAMLRIVGLGELVARDSEELVEHAVRIAGDRQFRATLSSRIRAGLPRLFDRSEPIAALADHLERLCVQQR